MEFKVYNNPMHNLAGMRFGLLVVVERAGLDTRYKGTRPVRWKCKCDCGNTSIVVASNLKRGVTKSCGCQRRWLSSQRRLSLVLDPDVAILKSIARAYRAGAARKGRVFLLLDEEVLHLVTSNCRYCGDPPSRLVKLQERLKTPQGELKTNGIDRVDNALGYTLENCVPCCTICNNAKKSMSLREWLAYLARIVAFRTKK